MAWRTQNSRRVTLAVMVYYWERIRLKSAKGRDARAGPPSPSPWAVRTFYPLAVDLWPPQRPVIDLRRMYGVLPTREAHCVWCPEFILGLHCTDLIDWLFAHRVASSLQADWYHWAQSAQFPSHGWSFRHGQPLPKTVSCGWPHPREIPAPLGIT